MVTNHTRLDTLQASRGAVLIELVVALAIFGSAVIPLAFTFAQEKKLCESYYHRAIAMEIIDGEMEVLVAGEWRSFHEGAQSFRVNAASATNLPPGEFVLTLHAKQLRLEWIPGRMGTGSRVVRETVLP